MKLWGEKLTCHQEKNSITRTLLEEGQYTQQEIATRLKISQKSVSRINKRMKSAKYINHNEEGNAVEKVN